MKYDFLNFSKVFGSFDGFLFVRVPLSLWVCHFKDMIVTINIPTKKKGDTFLNGFS